MGLFTSNKNTFSLPWVQLESVADLKAAWDSSGKKIFFKHSTRCSISSMALNRFEKEWKGDEKIQLYFIDLIQFRPVSNELEQLSAVTHQSPQVISVNNQAVLHNCSHGAIDAQEIEKQFNHV